MYTIYVYQDSSQGEAFALSTQEEMNVNIPHPLFVT